MYVCSDVPKYDYGLANRGNVIVFGKEKPEKIVETEISGCSKRTVFRSDFTRITKNALDEDVIRINHELKLGNAAENIGNFLKAKVMLQKLKYKLDL